MPASTFQDNASSCRSSPMQWKPMPVPMPGFDFRDLVAAEEPASWEHCMRILNNGNRSLTRSSASAYPIFGSASSDHQVKRPNRYLVQSPEQAVSRNLSARLAEVRVEDVTMRDRCPTSVSRATSPMPSEFSDFPPNIGGTPLYDASADASADPCPGAASGQPHSSIFKRFFSQRAPKKSLSRSSSISSLFRSEEPRFVGNIGGGIGGSGDGFSGATCGSSRQKKPTKSPGPQPRLSSVGLTGDADPRISSTNLASDSFYCGEEFGVGHMNRWLQQQEWTAMAARAESHLTELSEMLQYAMKSLGDLKAADRISEAADHISEEMQQRQKSRYYAT